MFVLCFRQTSRPVLDRINNSEAGQIISSQLNVLNHQLHVNVLSQAAADNALLNSTSAAAVSVWSPYWCVTASPTVLTVQMRARDALRATAPVHRLLDATINVSALQTGRSVKNTWILCIDLLFLLCLFKGSPDQHRLCVNVRGQSSNEDVLPSCRGVTVLQVSHYMAVPCPVWTLTSATHCSLPHASTPASTPAGPTSVIVTRDSTWSLTTEAARQKVREATRAEGLTESCRDERAFQSSVSYDKHDAHNELLYFQAATDLQFILTQ